MSKNRKTHKQIASEIFEIFDKDQTAFNAATKSRIRRLVNESAKSNSDNFLTPGQAQCLYELRRSMAKVLAYQTVFFDKIDNNKEFKQKFQKALIYYMLLSPTDAFESEQKYAKYLGYIRTGAKFLIKENEVNRMFGNKYFSKCWAGFVAEPRFGKGCLVQMKKDGHKLKMDVNRNKDHRANHSRLFFSKMPVAVKIKSFLNTATNRGEDRLRTILSREFSSVPLPKSGEHPLFVLSVDPIFPVNPRSGNKVYTVLSLGSTEVDIFSVEEGQLKKWDNVKNS